MSIFRNTGNHCEGNSRLDCFLPWPLCQLIKNCAAASNPDDNEGLSSKDSSSTAASPAADRQLNKRLICNKVYSFSPASCALAIRLRRKITSCWSSPIKGEFNNDTHCSKASGRLIASITDKPTLITLASDKGIPAEILKPLCKDGDVEMALFGSKASKKTLSTSMRF